MENSEFSIFKNSINDNLEKKDYRYGFFEEFVNDYKEFCFWHENILYISEGIRSKPNVTELLHWLNQHSISTKWFEEADFAVQYNNIAHKTKTGDNEMQCYVVSLLQKDYELKASDIHIVNTGNYTRIKLRILGYLTEHDQKNAEFGDHLLTMLYNYFAQQTGAAVFNRLQRLDGRIINPQVLPQGVYAIRLHSEPIQSECRDAGTFMALRLLYDSSEAKGDLEERLSHLGFDPWQIADLHAMTKRGGLALISGPTGHGKSTTLKHILEGLVQKFPERSYFSVEDPPEYLIEGVNLVILFQA